VLLQCLWCWGHWTIWQLSLLSTELLAAPWHTLSHICHRTEFALISHATVRPSRSPAAVPRPLQRAIRAGKLREKLPSVIEELRALLAEWKDCEGEVRRDQQIPFSSQQQVALHSVGLGTLGLGQYSVMVTALRSLFDTRSAGWVFVIGHAMGEGVKAPPHQPSHIPGCRSVCTTSHHTEAPLTHPPCRPLPPPPPWHFRPAVPV